ncbi:MAG: hypothetical protein FWF79_09590 [Defluviitaleaceae bacterium]|nr:hypothetical protein [Defluviitaleaceae bacterium]
MRRVLCVFIFFAIAMGSFGTVTSVAQEFSETEGVNAFLDTTNFTQEIFDLIFKSPSQTYSTRIHESNSFDLHTINRNRYDESFFEDKFLYLYFHWEGSCDFRLEVTSITIENSIGVEITRTGPGPGEDVTTGEENWLLVLEICRTLSNKDVSVAIITSSEQPPTLEQIQETLQAMIGTIVITNETTAESIMASVENSITNSAITASWLIPFNITPSTPTESGWLTGTIQLTESNSSYRDIVIDRTFTHFGNVPATGVANITWIIVAMFAFIALSVMTGTRLRECK